MVNSTDRMILKAGESMVLQSLVSPNGAYALEHLHDGTLELRDNVTLRDVWHIGTPAAYPGLVSLLAEGVLVLEARPGVHAWHSGAADRRVVAAMVKDNGSLVLIDQDGYPLWTKDPLSAADLASYRPASGDRLLPGEILANSIVSPNGRYRLTHTSGGETVLTTLMNDDRVRVLWSRTVGSPGETLSLGADGVLRAGANSMVLPKWTGLLRLDPTTVRAAALIVRDVGDIVLLDEQGAEICSSETAEEEVRRARLDQEFSDEEAENDTRPVRPAGSGLPTDWFDLLNLSDVYTITLVQHTDGHEALRQLGAPAETIEPMTYEQLRAAVRAGVDGRPVKGALAVPIDNWVMVIEPGGIEAMLRGPEMSKWTQAIVYHLGFDGNHFFSWYQDNEPLATYNDDDGGPDFLRYAVPAPEGVDPSVVVPFMEQIGVGTYREEDESGNFLPRLVEVACLIAEIEPRPEHFAGPLPGAVFGPW
jgi:hypothetical protein